MRAVAADSAEPDGSPEGSENDELARLAGLVGMRVGQLASDDGEPISRVPEYSGDSAALTRVSEKLDARAGAADPNPSLDRVAALMDLLGSPERTLKVIQVAGTNGKTSTARMTESLLRALGHRVGLFTSPELTRVTETMLIDGAEITRPSSTKANWLRGVSPACVKAYRRWLTSPKKVPTALLTST